MPTYYRCQAGTSQVHSLQLMQMSLQELSIQIWTETAVTKPGSMWCRHFLLAVQVARDSADC